MNDSVYYRIYLSSHTEKMTVVQMQWFDEDDYYSQRFYSENGMPLSFEDEDEAITFLNKRFKSEFIDPEYLRETNLWSHMLRPTVEEE